MSGVGGGSYASGGGERECARVSGVRGWVICEAEAGRTGEHDEVRLVCMLTWVDEGRDMGGDAVTPHYKLSTFGGRLHN